MDPGTYTFDHYDIYFEDLQDQMERYVRGFEAYQQFLALSNQEARGSGSGPKARTYIPHEREEAEQRLIDDEKTPLKYPETNFRRSFDKIINKEIPAKIVYEDDKVLAFRDIAPQAPTHILLIPKVRDGLTGLSKAEERHIGILGHLLYIAKVVAKQEGLEEGYRIVINDGPQGCQSVYHIHVHLIGGRQMNWPPG